MTLHDIERARNIKVPVSTLTSGTPVSAIMGSDDAERSQSGIYLVSLRSLAPLQGVNVATEATALRRTVASITRGYGGATDRAQLVPTRVDVTRQGCSFAIAAKQVELTFQAARSRNLPDPDSDDALWVSVEPLTPWTDKRFAPPKLTQGIFQFPADAGVIVGVPTGARELIMYGAGGAGAPPNGMIVQYYADLSGTIPLGYAGNDLTLSGQVGAVLPVPALARSASFDAPAVAAVDVLVEWTIDP